MIFPFLHCCFHYIPHLRLLHSRSYKQVHRLFPFQSQSLVLHRISLSFLIGLIYMLMPHEFITLFYLLHYSFHVGNADLCCSFEGPLLYHMSQLTRLQQSRKLRILLSIRCTVNNLLSLPRIYIPMQLTIVVNDSFRHFEHTLRMSNKSFQVT